MSSIKILDTHTINKIAAGEVVERPASVVKELVENSIDAKASSITVEIKNGGIDFIRITDNGKGIPKDEVEIAFLRHATSKITNADDLLEVLSLGFRGEALASIASVSKVELITKTSDDLTGKRIEVSAGKIQSSEEIACPDGTTFIMRHLFYNVPARKEFLKSTGTEASKIADYMYKLALAHPEISFKYIQNNKLVFNTSGNHELQSCVLSLYGKEVAKNTIKLNYQDQGIQVVGLLGKPTLTRGNRNYEHFFINGRYIKSFLLQKAVEEAYKTLTMIGKFPFVVLHLQINPNLVDVNVHPTKLEVRFKESEKIYQVVYKGVLAHLHEENLIPEVSQTFMEKPKFKSEHTNNTQLFVDSFFAPRKPDNDLNLTTLVDRKEKTAQDPHEPIPKIFNSSPENRVVSSLDTINLVDSGDIVFKEEQVLSEPTISEAIHTPFLYELPIENERVSLEVSTIPPINATNPVYIESVEEVSPPVTIYKPVEGIDYQIIGQLFNTYWLIEHEGAVLIIDQHAAHERVMYEKFMHDFTSGTVATQVLLVPETINLPASEMLLIEENMALFKNLGFHLEVFGDHTIILREVPYLFNKPLGVEHFKHMLDSLDIKNTKSLYELKEESIIQMACKSAIKANDRLDSKECKLLIESLLMLENPYTCPHGRPTIVRLKHSDIEKIFKRI